MLPQRTDRALFALLIAVVLLIAYATMGLNAAAAEAYVLGAADGTTEAAPLAAQLGARTYRLVMDPAVPIDAYAPRVEAYRAVGMRPQIVVGGTGTSVRGKTTAQKWRIINYALHALKRWPDAYSVGVVNEPNLSGISACQYARTFRTAYKMLKAAGAQRVLFGEWSPGQNILAWTSNAMDCVKGDTVADGWAWHCYDMGPDWFGITHVGQIGRYLRAMRHGIHTRHGRALPIHCTEYGVPTAGSYMYSGQNGAAYWARAFAYVRKYRVEQIVAWGIIEVGKSSQWETSVVDAEGNPRAAFATIASAR